MLPAQVSHEPSSEPPVEQIGWAQVEPPPPPPTHTPPEQLSPDAHEPQLPPQPSSPQVLPLQLGVQVPPPPPSALPFGEPMPVGPSQPAPALHSTLPHVPFLPVVTSKNFDAFEYAQPGALLPSPYAAYTPATNGVDALVPPTTIQPPFAAL